MRKGQLVLVTWSDIVTELCADELSEPLVAYHVGMIHKQDKKTLWLKSGWYKNEKDFPSKDGIAIPKGTIDKIEVLETVCD